MGINILLVGVAAIAAAAPPNGQESAVDKIVVLPSRISGGIEEKKGDLLDEVLMVELARRKPEKIGIVGSADIAAVVGLEQQKQLMNCDEASCLVELGNALGASHILSLSLGTVGSQFLISSKVISSRDAKIAHRGVIYTADDEDALLAGVRQTSAEVARSLGWIEGAAGADAVTSVTPGTTAADTGEAEELDPLLWVGAGMTGVGALLFGGLGAGAMAVDAVVVGDAATTQEQRVSGADTVLLLGGGSLIGLAALSAGAALVLTSLL